MTSEEALADRVLAAGRRRRRRRSAWLAAGVLTAVVAVARPLLAGPDGAAAAGAASPAAGTSTSSALAHALASDQALIYVAALRSGPAASSGRGEVYVRDHVCESVISKPGSQCADDPIPLSVRREMTQLLPFPVRFVAGEWGPRNGPHKSLTVFGTLTVTHGNRATLGIETLCGMWCAEGKTLVLARTADDWRVTGQTGPEWIT